MMAFLVISLKYKTLIEEKVITCFFFVPTPNNEIKCTLMALSDLFPFLTSTLLVSLCNP